MFVAYAVIAVLLALALVASASTKLPATNASSRPAPNAACTSKQVTVPRSR